jgi:hypothetical protein
VTSFWPLELATDHDDVIVATTNTTHLSRYVAAARWDRPN